MVFDGNIQIVKPLPSSGNTKLFLLIMTKGAYDKLRASILNSYILNLSLTLLTIRKIDIVF